MNDEMIYNILIAKYMEKQNLENEFFIFPYDFTDDLNIRIQVLVEAINKNIKIEKTDKFLEYVEGVREI